VVGVVADAVPWQATCAVSTPDWKSSTGAIA
jgi:hypothetical protein